MSFLFFSFDLKKVAKDLVIVANILRILLNFTFFGSHCNSQSNKKAAEDTQCLILALQTTEYRNNIFEWYY